MRYTVILVLSFLMHDHVVGSHLDLISGGNVNHLFLGSGDGRKYHALMDPPCGSNEYCKLTVALFDRVSSEVIEYPMEIVAFNHNGSLAIGYESRGGERQSVFRRIDTGENIEIPYHRPSTDLYDISADGSKVLGGGGNHILYLWDEQGRHRISRPGPERLLDATLSNDGSVVYGVVKDKSGHHRGAGLFRWTSENGPEIVAPLRGSIADVSADGAIVVGASEWERIRTVSDDGRKVSFETRESGGFRWSAEGGFEELAILPKRVSGDGQTIIGRAPDAPYDSMIWTAGSLVSFSDLILRETGIDVATQIVDVSQDGLTLSGHNLLGTVVILRLGDFEGCDLNADHACDALDVDAMAAIPDEMLRSAFDLNSDGNHDFTDRKIWVQDLMSTQFGDANLDKEFDNSDLMQVFQNGYFESGVDSSIGWSDGDWNGDRQFDSSDFVLAFRSGAYERSTNIVSVPEPHALTVFLVPLIVFQHSIRPRSCLQS